MVTYYFSKFQFKENWLTVQMVRDNVSSPRAESVIGCYKTIELTDPLWCLMVTGINFN